MKEQLYTIPVNEAFDQDCECPICVMYRSLEKGAIEFTMGPSYMEDDIRMETDEKGFCEHHLKLMYQNQNRLGLALMLHTHMKKTINDLEKLSKEKTSKGSLFKKQENKSAVGEYIKKLNGSCYVCERIKRLFNRYIVTVFYLYRTDAEFRKKMLQSKGICTKHYGVLYEAAERELGKKEAEEFISSLNTLYLENMKRVLDDLEWYTDKFDYRYANEPWKNSKDAVPRTLLKIKGIWEDELE